MRRLWWASRDSRRSERLSGEATVMLWPSKPEWSEPIEAWVGNAEDGFLLPWWFAKALGLRLSHGEAVRVELVPKAAILRNPE